MKSPGSISHESTGNREVLSTIKRRTKFSCMSEAEVRSNTTLSIPGTGSHSLLSAKPDWLSHCGFRGRGTHLASCKEVLLLAVLAVWTHRGSNGPSDQKPFFLCSCTRCHCSKEVCTFRAMKCSGGAAPEASLCDLYRWVHHRESWQRGRLLPAAQQQLDRNHWTAPDFLPSRPDSAMHRSDSVPEDQGWASPGGRIPYIRSRSEPGTGREKGRSNGSFLSSFTQRISRFLTQRHGPESGRQKASCLS